MSSRREYAPLVKARYGPGGAHCRCCQPGLDKVHSRRVLRRKRRQETAVLQPAVDYEPYDDYDDDYDYVSHERLVLWRMTTDPFRLVPSWVRAGGEERYAAERMLWALAGEPICEIWGVPTELCDAISDLSQVIRVAHTLDEDTFYLFSSGCGHVFRSAAV